jgi:magnesium transporter
MLERIASRRTETSFAPPGTLRSSPNAAKPVLRVIAYGPDDFVEEKVTSIDDVAAYLAKWPVVWLNVDGLGDVTLLERLGGMFRLHPLALEDVTTLNQRAKLEEYSDHLFFVARMAEFTERIQTEQVSLFMGPHFVVTLQEKPGDCLDPVRERIRNGRGRVRSAGPDYLSYAILDAIVDGYFPILEAYSERLEEMEEEVILRPTDDALLEIRRVKRDLLRLRRAVWPLREALSSAMREGSTYFTEDTGVYLRDCYDHVIQAIDMVETYRELGSGLMDAHMSSVSNRMNEVMKVLTIFASIFIPLTFIAGIYGMNFNPEASRWNMPELNQPYGYIGAWAVMVLVAVIMMLYFRAKGWLGRK